MAEKQKFNTGYGPIPEADTVVEGESMTEQSHTKHCDINNIIKRFKRDGVIEHVNEREAQYTDTSSCPDYHGALEIVRQTEQMFASMPAVLRDKFENDAGVYLEWINDPENRAEAEELKLLPPSVEPEAPPLKVSVVNATETGEKGGAGGASEGSQNGPSETPESSPAGAEGGTP